jgi:hypothetical protein
MTIKRGNLKERLLPAGRKLIGETLDGLCSRCLSEESPFFLELINGILNDRMPSFAFGVMHSLQQFLNSDARTDVIRCHHVKVSI